MVRILLSDGRKLAVVVLGAAHDLRDHLPADAECIRLRVPAVD